MHFKFRNVNDAFQFLVGGIHSGSIPTTVMPSRYGEVLKVDEPVTVTYEKPLERVLFNQERDCNPFFHLYESLWMLAGRQDVAPLAYYNSQIAEVASDDGLTFHGAYGARWRRHFGYDQLEVIINELRANPWSRRCVLSMWDANSCQGMSGHRDDLHVAVTGGSKDVPCNTHAYFLVEPGPCIGCDGGKTLMFAPCEKCNGTPSDQPRYLTMTVMNRSNDMIWGMLGANVVHFAFLQEYLAACIGLEVGSYHQITNNLHVYTERWHPEKWLEKPAGKRTMHDPQVYTYEKHVKNPGPPLVENVQAFNEQHRMFVERHSQNSLSEYYTEPFLERVAQPMSMAYHHYKLGDITSALTVMDSVKADDWRIAGTNWLFKRKRRRDERGSRSKQQELSSQ